MRAQPAARPSTMDRLVNLALRPKLLDRFTVRMFWAQPMLYPAVHLAHSISQCTTNLTGVIVTHRDEAQPLVEQVFAVAVAGLHFAGVTIGVMLVLELLDLLPEAGIHIVHPVAGQRRIPATAVADGNDYAVVHRSHVVATVFALPRLIVVHTTRLS